METEMATVAGLTREQIDPLRSEALRRELPGLAEALDEELMRGRLQALLFGADAPTQIERCNPGQAIYLGGDVCGLRYELELRDRESGAAWSHLVLGRVFRDRAACRSFMDTKLGPVAALAEGRPDLAAFARIAASIEALGMVVHAFPTDGELPILLDATDPELMVAALAAESLGDFRPQRCTVELAQYGRRHRCTLRYILDGADAAGAPARRVVYGKVANDGTGARTVPVIAALREALSAPGDTDGVRIPRVIAYRPELQLLLLEAIPGRPQIARLLKARLAGKPEGEPDAPTLEGAMRSCGQIAAAIHSSGIGLGRERTLEDELAWQERGIAELGRITPELGTQLLAWLRQIAEAGRRGAALPLGFAHGDFTYTQLIFDGAQSGLVDFDTVCQAEPALDLGQFLAYQGLNIRRNRRADSPDGLAEKLGAGFLEAYLAAMGDRIGDAQALKARAHIYELLMLSRLAIHSWQKLKVSRLEHAMKLIEERIAWLP
jgi:hypothetical protein